jgi:diguanylate cyclase (GGDEF)-like protein
VLATLARRLQDAVREGDVVGRLGGDEFVVLCHDLGGVEARAIAERVRVTCTMPIHVRGTTASVGASVGIALAAPDEAAAMLLRRADTAVYAAKRDGRGRVRVSDQMSSAA